MILNKDQAKAVFDAMLALNNVCGKINASLQPGLPTSQISVLEFQNGNIAVSRYHFGMIEASEVYEDQNKFSAAYEL